jgi:hypothetical protein
MRDGTDKWRHDTLAGIVQLAPTSPLIAIPAIQASVTALATLGASLKADNDTVAAGRTKLALDIETEANTRRAVDGELLTGAWLRSWASMRPRSRVRRHARGLRENRRRGPTTQSS